jgi:hypothetical protein
MKSLLKKNAVKLQSRSEKYSVGYCDGAASRMLLCARFQSIEKPRLPLTSPVAER